VATKAHYFSVSLSCVPIPKFYATVSDPLA
jgi:hypothetical protein